MELFEITAILADFQVVQSGGNKNTDLGWIAWRNIGGTGLVYSGSAGEKHPCNHNL